ncbi:Transmembrane exosortase [Posidoniimonas polymericola]|uniref:Transmembrane exosortase n=1 Tax=Posidoniimonas polymericola TaxID=2528002 RepID=A0A5C5YUJ7_9BACT|nr:exosortase/archaeosortase family protein [Posidoniimonas polymericola]TWT78501.1 Transmembrane exosortase [Posidoniimonas polymericola]
MAANFPAAFPGAAGNQPQRAELPDFSWQDSTQRNAWLAAMLSASVLVWSYWIMFKDAAADWDQPQYSHGWILPLIAMVMMWMLRPNKATSGRVETALQAVGGAAIALVVASQWVPGLQGVGLAVACLGGFGCVLWGQPFAPMEGSGGGLTFEKPALLWILTGVGVALTAAGLAGVGFGPINPDVLSMLGLMTITIGFILAAAFHMPPTVVSWSEVMVGFAVILLCCVAWGMGVYYDRMPLAQAAFVTSTIGVLTLIGGMRLLRWTGPPIAFLMFMFPLPSLVEQHVLGTLQKIAVTLSEAVYTIMGVAAIRSGNRITLPGLNDDIEMEIAEACSGLSMTNILFAMCVAIAILTTRPWWDRLIILISALPIAIISNVFRIVVTGFIWMAMDQFLAGGDPESIAKFRDPIHSWIGLIVMMPFALGLMMLELKILSSLSVPEESSLGKSQVIGRGASGVPGK